ncbi:Aste57867_3677 [Aphanomyces stellatus]|uniref:Aste57867_3677 protein n=1 Tax=Aphanomyces stellatus TaxID=120398 RepID=A0A485KB73_9STRA|nr:hypothetical protein As57867_003666 [Aphanomyces stellatus]VFT80832.1 Aste57867_3677 [Aphanomyces stellatus]
MGSPRAVADGGAGFATVERELSILEALAVADCNDLALTTNHTKQFNLAHGHASIIEKLQLVHASMPLLAVEARLADLAQLLNGEEVEDAEATVLMAEFSRVFAELCHGAPSAAQFERRQLRQAHRWSAQSANQRPHALGVQEPRPHSRRGGAVRRPGNSRTAQ